MPSFCVHMYLPVRSHIIKPCYTECVHAVCVLILCQWPQDTMCQCAAIFTLILLIRSVKRTQTQTWHVYKQRQTHKHTLKEKLINFFTYIPACSYRHTRTLQFLCNVLCHEKGSKYGFCNQYCLITRFSWSAL